MQNIEEIYDKYFKTVNKYLFCLTKNEDTAENLTQETFYRAVKNINKFKGNCNISTWLCEIAKNAYYDECRKNKKIKYISDEELATVQSNKSVEEITLDSEEKIELYNRIKKLDKNTREVIILRIIGEFSFKEIGNIVNKTETWARVTFYRGKDTGLLIRTFGGTVTNDKGTFTIVNDYLYEFGTVTDDNFIEPKVEG